MSLSDTVATERPALGTAKILPYTGREYLDSLAVFDHPDNENIAFKTLLYFDAVYEYMTSYKVKLLLGDSSGEKLFKDEYAAIDAHFRPPRSRRPLEML